MKNKKKEGLPSSLSFVFLSNLTTAIENMNKKQNHHESSREQAIQVT
jgi:hypothetical protein